MPANLENSAVATGLEKVNFHSNPKERQWQRMFKLPCNCTHLNGEGNGSPLQYACLENPRDGGDWWAAVNMPENLENSAVASGLEKVSFLPIPRKGNAKECSNYCTIALISHASKVMLKILQARLQQYMNCELPDVQAGFRKGRGSRDQMAKIRWIIEKAREFKKTHLFLLY